VDEPHGFVVPSAEAPRKRRCGRETKRLSAFPVYEALLLGIVKDET